jgi:hypothetical protein
VPKSKMLLHTTRHVWSGTCVCGHHADEHHGNCIMVNDGTIEAMGSAVILSECEHFGVNEYWEECPKCPGWFVDKDDPLKDEKIKELKGTGS